MDGRCNTELRSLENHHTSCKDGIPVGVRRSVRFANKPSLDYTKVSRGSLERARRFYNRQRKLSIGVCKSNEATMNPKKLAPEPAKGVCKSSEAEMNPKKLAPEPAKGLCKSNEAKMNPKKLAPKPTNGSNAGDPIEISEESEPRAPMLATQPRAPMLATQQTVKREKISNGSAEDEGMESFPIVVNGLIIDSELSTSVKSKYYKLCSSQDTPLHSKLESLNLRFVIGAILETLDIADAIKSAKPCTSQNDIVAMEKSLAAWEKSLEALTNLGMNVRFLCTRVQRLKMIMLESKQLVELHEEVVVQQVNMNNEVTIMKKKLDELEKGLKSLDAKRMGLIAKSRAYQSQFRSEVDSPW